jgi:hypothetical protein
MGMAVQWEYFWDVPERNLTRNSDTPYRCGICQDDFAWNDKRLHLVETHKLIDAYQPLGVVNLRVIY